MDPRSHIETPTEVDSFADRMGAAEDAAAGHGDLTTALAVTFTDLRAEELVVLVDKADRLAYADGETVIARGSSPNGIFVLVKGKVRISLEVPTGGGATVGLRLNQLGPGSIFGEMSFLDEDEASTDVIADGDIEVMRISAAAIDKIKQTDYTFSGRFYRSLAKTLSRRLRSMNARLVLGMGHPYG
jgi:CRP-like cAMP-binding protein